MQERTCLTFFILLLRHSFHSFSYTPPGAPPSLQSSSPPAELSHTVIVKDVPYSVDLEKVKAHFEKFGPIVSLRRHALHVRIGFATKAAWSEAVGNHSVDGCDLLAQEAMTVDEHKKTFAKNCKIFQLSPQISQWDLIEYFARFGRVKYIYKPHHINTVAYVTFAEEASALEAEAERWHYLKGTKFGVNSSARRISVAQTKPIVSRFGSMW